MPDARCPDCRNWSRRERWATAPGQPFPFRLVCPRCGHVADVAEVEYRLGEPTPVARTCDRCPAPMPSPADPLYDDWTLDDWTLIPGQGDGADEIACPRCILLSELAARIGWERERGYRWRARPTR